VTTTLNGQTTTADAAGDIADRLSAAGVKYAAISFVDMHGKPKCKMVPLGHLVQAALGSEMFTGAALDGVPQDVNDDEVAPHPDLSAPIVMPFNREIAWFPGICGSAIPRSRRAADRSSSG
jgi:glutamine synthetase